MLVQVNSRSLLQWTMAHRAMLKPGVPFDLVRHRYLVDVYGCTAGRMVIFKAGQMGASEYAVSYALHAADARSATVLYVFPTDTHVSDFSSARIGPAMEVSPYLESIVVDGSGEEGKRGANRVTLKRVRDRFLYLRGGKVNPDGTAAQLKSIDADIIILDEVDEMDARAPEIARKRLGHSSIGEERDISTPTYSGVGIHGHWLESDQRAWHVACPHCGLSQPLTLEQIVLEWDDLKRPVAWHGMDEGRAWIACRRCGKELDRLAPGRWVAKYPSRPVVGFHLTKLFSHLYDPLQVVTALQSVDDTKRKEAINQDLGLPYTAGSGQITDEVLDDCRRPYAHGPAPQEDHYTFMGVDVGDPEIYVVIRGDVRPGKDGAPERPQRFAGIVNRFEELDHLIRRYNVTTCVVDAGPETRAARELRNRHWGVVWLATYAGGEQELKMAEAVVWNREDGTARMARTRTLDATFARFIGTENVPAENTLPANIRSVEGYYDQMKAPVKVQEKNSRGNTIARYVEGTAADHMAHAENYCCAASLRAGGWGI
jgi:hypothetical protein